MSSSSRFFWGLVWSAGAALADSAPAQYLQPRLIVQPGPFNGYPRNLQAIDIDQDGALDILAVDSVVRWVRSPSFATMAEMQAPSVLYSAPTAGAVAGRVDADPFCDVLVADYYGACWLRSGSGTGSLSPAVPLALTLPTGCGLLPADCDGDGRTDVVTWSQSWPTSDVRVHLNRHPNWPAAVVLTPALASGPPVIGDFDGDGRDDVCWAPPTGPGPPVLAYASGGAAPVQTTIVAVGQPLVPKAAADLDRDGRDDLLLLGGLGPYSVAVCFGSDATVLEAAIPLGPAPGAFLLASRLRVVDINADGIADILVPPEYAGTSPQPFFVLPGLGARAFAPALAPDWSCPVSPGQDDVAGDFDGDGDTDLVRYGFNVLMCLENRALRGACCGSIPGGPRIATGVARTGNAAFEVRLELSPPGRPSGLFLSLGAQAPSYCAPGVDLSPGLLLLPSGAAGLSITETSGTAAVALPLPASAALAGATVFAQWAVDDPGGGFVSGGRNYALTPTRTIIIW